MSSKIGIIGGSGIYEVKELQKKKEEKIKTPYGEILVSHAKWGDSDLFFLPRHGKNHKIPPHKVNYRGNIYALKLCGVDRILSTSASGSLNKKIKPGEVVFINQFIDFTKSRPSTFFDEGDVFHVDMSEPYCPELHNLFIKVASELDMKFHPEGTYLCTEGPRFETPAEIKAFKIMGADVVGMTNVPEVILSREAEICYASVAVVTNMAAGIEQNKLTSDEVSQAMQEMSQSVIELILKVIKEIPARRNCACRNALKGSKM
ncbi:S-methyl-5'-thioadenosine phosphorylase [Candidatus Oleimmundimicrobium sp.]|uniref:S-methyl-5'-thioadenosine phosphorylase n=1 Tax=Candidatus Oleimmundimicrobium sp. TaxID=3060597 RepID=UPI00271EC33E|nr:S-methyl-5'-thioadenosine phosphorylase [Candidatus Oleimmundimicrobium sp.]MDO8885376.1 S-methyl-5'-thioadenosine phosphorylase [Candidatus Oleimmundimicrobium sp.]